MRACVLPISVVVSESSEHWNTIGINCVKVNCDITGFMNGVGWIFLGSHCNIF